MLTDLKCLLITGVISHMHRNISWTVVFFFFPSQKKLGPNPYLISLTTCDSQKSLLLHCHLSLGFILVLFGFQKPMSHLGGGGQSCGMEQSSGEQKRESSMEKGAKRKRVLKKKNMLQEESFETSFLILLPQWSWFLGSDVNERVSPAGRLRECTAQLS